MFRRWQPSGSIHLRLQYRMHHAPCTRKGLPSRRQQFNHMPENHTMRHAVTCMHTKTCCPSPARSVTASSPPATPQVKKIVFNHVPEDHVFGYMPTIDPEGAREITMIWKSHTSSPGADARPDGKPNLDFTAMNKLAAKRWVQWGLGQQRGEEAAARGQGGEGQVHGEEVTVQVQEGEGQVLGREGPPRMPTRCCIPFFPYCPRLGQQAPLVPEHAHNPSLPSPLHPFPPSVVSLSPASSPSSGALTASR